VVVLGLGTDVVIRAQRAGNILGEELLERLAADAADDLTDQGSVGDRVIADGGTRLPPGF
jgi:hypothetical protein